MSKDPQFIEKAAQIVELYLNPPKDGMVLSIDEKPSIQALSRQTGYVKTRGHKIMHAVKSTYRRNGTQNLFACLEVGTGEVHGKVTKRKTREDFLEFMDCLVKELPTGQQYYIVMDNYCIHKRNDAWLMKHPNFHFYFTPTSASWLNQVEIWFNIFTRRVLRWASFDSTEQLKSAIYEYLDFYNCSPSPFHWKKRQIHGSQIADNVKNLCN